MWYLAWVPKLIELVAKTKHTRVCLPGIEYVATPMPTDLARLQLNGALNGVNFYKFMNFMVNFLVIWNMFHLVIGLLNRARPD